MNEQAQNLSQVLLTAMETHADQTCFRFKQIKQVKQGGRYQRISYRRFQTLTLRLASFFRRYGLTKGEGVAIIADNCLEWMVAYVACLLSGGVAVPVPTALTPDMLSFILRDSGARVAVVQGEEQSHILEDIVEGLPRLETVLTINIINNEEMLGAFPMATVLARKITAEEREAILTCAESIAPHDLACIHYTTGKTNKPRGVAFDHAQRLKAMQSLAEWFTLSEDDLAFTIHSWGYEYSLDVTLHYFLSGVANFIDHVNSRHIDLMIENAQQISPTIMLLTPANLEAFYTSIMMEMQWLPEASRDVFHWALAVSKEYQAAGLTASQALREQYERANMTFFSPIRGRVGGRMRRIYSVGAPLPAQLIEFFEAIRIPLLNLYNITEAGGFPAISRPDAYRVGSCGQVGPGFQIRIADDDEVLVRSETIMRQYWQQPQETRRIIDPDGWLHTGDLGRFDRDGYLYLIGLKETLIMLSTSQKVMPAILENTLTASPFITQAAIFGNGRPYISALIVPNLAAVTAHLQQDSQEEAEAITTLDHPAVKTLIDQVVAEVNNQLALWEWIREYRLLDHPLSDSSDEPAATTKANRQLMAEQYVRQIKAMYPMSLQPARKTLTQGQSVQHIQHVQIEPSHLQELLEKQSVLDAWMEDAGIGFLFDLARARQIDAPSMVHICETVVAIAQIQSEEKPLSTALIVGDPARIARILPYSEIQLQRYDHVRRMRREIVALAKMVDGLVLGYGVDKHGYVRGIHKLEVALAEAGSFLLGRQSRHHAAISQHCNAVVFFVPPGGRQVRVFADGHLVGRYANGSWLPESIPRIDKAVVRLAEQKNYDLALLQRILSCAFQMSEQNLGAIFIVGDADLVLERSDPPEISSFAMIANANIDQLSERELVNFAKQDGATVIDSQGRFRGCMVLLRPAAGTQAEIGLGKGARHSSAAKMSAEGQCLAITVSQDGPITVYDSGRKILAL